MQPRKGTFEVRGAEGKTYVSLQVRIVGSGRRRPSQVAHRLLVLPVASSWGALMTWQLVPPGYTLPLIRLVDKVEGRGGDAGRLPLGQCQ
jgi:hypothetical protein